MRTLQLAAVVLAAGSVGAADLTPLGNAGDWHVEQGYDALAGAIWCTAETVNARGQGFGITAGPDGTAIVYVADPGWAAPPRVVHFSIDIDDKRWSIEGEATAGTIAVPLAGNGSAGWFLRELAAGAGVVVVDEAGAEVGAFSLAGVEQALGTLARCSARIRPEDGAPTPPVPV